MVAMVLMGQDSIFLSKCFGHLSTKHSQLVSLPIPNTRLLKEQGGTKEGGKRRRKKRIRNGNGGRGREASRAASNL